MSEPPPKKLKQTEILSCSSSPETATDSESGESSEDRDNVQKKMDYSFKKEVEEGPSKHLQQKAEEKKHTFQFCLNTEIYSVTCNTSMTVLEALNISPIFRKERKKKKNMQKEVLILRPRGPADKAAVKSDFPCCLIEGDEVVDLEFIKNEGTSSTNQQSTAGSLLRKEYKPETIVTFWIKRDGGKNVQRLLKSKALRNKVQSVCVYAFKGEEIKTALKHDGRFKNIIFKKHCALSEVAKQGMEIKHELSNPVDKLDGKAFQVVVVSDMILPDSQDDLTLVKTEPNVASDADVAETVGSCQNPINNEQEKKQDGNTKSTNPSTKPIADSKEILGILRNQFPVLLKQLQQREKLKSKSDVQKFFREEYGKSVENFLKVKNVKQLMKLSDSVCQIRQGGSAIGTVFLLFDRYVLTNAHVIGESTDLTKVNAAQFTAVFGFEDLVSEDIKHIPVEQLAAYSYGKDDKGRHLDYALLELDDVENIAEYPKLLDCYSPNAPTNRGQICIVGHPGEGVKKMDPCFIIERDNLLEAAEKHTSENQHLIHFMMEKCSDQKWNKIPYNSCFFHGSSGSPVFDVDCNLIGIHTGGYTYKAKKGDKTWNIMEYGYSVQPILDNIRARARIKGLQNIVNVIEAYSNVPLTVEQQNQIDIEMESAEESDEL